MHTRRSLAALVLVTVLVPLAVGACSSGDASSDKTTAGPSQATVVADTPACPSDPIEIVVSVGQWTDLVQTLAGACGEVTTVITGDAGDPHDFEPRPSDLAAFEGADLVVLNGADFDHWAEDALEASRSSAAVLEIADAVGVAEGDNPHIWHSPTAVDLAASAVTSELSSLVPGADEYFAARAEQWADELVAYRERVDRLDDLVEGKTYAATESVFDPMALALGMDDVTPEGYRIAAANESEPSPGDLAAFEAILKGGTVAVLVFNAQTESALTAQIRAVAVEAGVPVVEVTETQPDGTTFVEWQVAQLDALEAALGVHAVGS